MVNITHKSNTLRKAIASSVIEVSKQETIDAIINKTVAKGDVFEFSRAAGLLAVKKTSDVIPDCHPLPIEYTNIRHTINGLKIIITVEVHTIYKTGVEVEAMHGAAITALTMYDMLKPIDKNIVIGAIQLEEKKGGKSDVNKTEYQQITSAVLVCSDSVFKGDAEDYSGIIIEEKLQQWQITIKEKIIVADEVQSIQAQIKQWVHQGVQLIIVTGGTGVSPRDITPEAVAALIQTEAPGIMETARNYGQQRTPYAMLSRGKAGFIEDTLIITLPGSPNGVSETIDAVFPAVLHSFKVRSGARH
jgi:molybdenum cofactor biosynthesis protein MoaC